MSLQIAYTRPLPSYHHHLCCLRTSVLGQVGSVSRRLLRTHETRRIIATTKPVTQREEVPLRLQAHSIAVQHQASCGEDHKQGLSRPVVAQYMCMACQNAPLLQSNQSMESCSCMHGLVELASLLSAKERPGQLWTRLASSGCRPKNSVLSGQRQPNGKSKPGRKIYIG